MLEMREHWNKIRMPKFGQGVQWGAFGWRTEADGIIDLRNVPRLIYDTDFGRTLYIIPNVRADRGFVRGDLVVRQL
jgi:hypothetical protein